MFNADDLQQLSGATSHELRDPVRVALGLLTDLAGDAPSDTRLPEASAQLSLTLQRLEALKSYLYLSENTERPQPAKLSTLFVQALKKAGAGNAKIEMAELPELPSARPQQLTEMFYQLIKNALSYNDSIPPVLRLDCHTKGRMLYITLQDNGCGMEPEYCHYVLGLFRRGDNVRELPGLGLGLAIAKKVAENHGGTLVLESEPGEWTRAIISLALAPDIA